MLAVAFGVLLVVVAGVSATLQNLSLGGENFWALAFVLAPFSMLVFAAAVRYAVWGGSFKEKGLTPTTRLLRDWSPFFFFVIFYAAFSGVLWRVLQPQDRDAWLLGIDRALFGETPAVAMQAIMSPVLTDLLAVCYFLHLVLPPLLALAIYSAKRTLFRELLLAVFVSSLIASVGYLLVPATGPGSAFPNLFDRPLEGIFYYEPIANVMGAARAPRDAFPSLHIGVSTVVLYFAWRHRRRWFWCLLPLVLGNWMATVYLRAHYVIDLLAGWLVAVASPLLTRWLLDLETRARARLEGISMSLPGNSQPRSVSATAQAESRRPLANSGSSRQRRFLPTSMRFVPPPR